MSAPKGKPKGIDIVARPERVEASLWRKLKESGDATARERIFSHYRSLARSIAVRYATASRSGNASRHDLEQAAYHGLLQSIDRFNIDLGVPFAAYARPRIRGSVAEAKAQATEADAQYDFSRRRQAETLRSIANDDAASGRSALDRLADIAVELALALLLDQQEERGNDLAGDSDNAFDSLAWRQMTRALSAHVHKLPSAERIVIEQHYKNDMMFVEIATLLGVNRSRVSQLHKSALQRLAKKLRRT